MKEGVVLHTFSPPYGSSSYGIRAQVCGQNLGQKLGDGKFLRYLVMEKFCCS